jgi:uncharacterized protein (TIGR04255 family)
MIGFGRHNQMNSQPIVEPAPFRPRIEDPTPFPDSERIIYSKNPLESVICQLRFPVILKIGAKPPVEFQEALRGEYPLFREIPPLDIATGLPPELSAMMSKLLPNPSGKAYEMTSSDGSWQLTLTQESLALSSKKYARWEQFSESLQAALGLLEKIYGPSFYTRIGLRYRNIITRRQLDLTDVNWNELLSPELACEFHSRIAGAVESTGHQIVLRLQADAAKVTLQHGLGSKDGEVCYIIDSDFYVNEKTGVKDAARILDYFNRQAGRLFKWCISDRLHRAMEPNAVD